MEDKRIELIQGAILDKLGKIGMQVYAADDILLVAGISQKEIEELDAKMKSEAYSLAKEAKKTRQVK